MRSKDTIEIINYHTEAELGDVIVGGVFRQWRLAPSEQSVAWQDGDRPESTRYRYSVPFSAGHFVRFSSCMSGCFTQKPTVRIRLRRLFVLR